jgi:hypothetical protein
LSNVVDRLEIVAGAERYTAKAAGIWSANDAVREAERELARQAEVAYGSHRGRSGALRGQPATDPMAEIVAKCDRNPAPAP